MKILVIGGGGFIGTHIVRAIHGAGFSVSSYGRSFLERLEGVEYFFGDFSDTAKLSEALNDVDVVIHSLSSTVPATSDMDPVNDIQQNLISTVRLLDLMEKKRVNRLVYLSSGGTVYGNPMCSPVDESSILAPISSYGAVKIAIENFINVATVKWGLEAIVLRPSNPYGEFQGHKGVQGLISTVIAKVMENESVTIYGDGTAIRDYLYVYDLALLVLEVVRRGGSGTYNAGSGNGHSVNAIIGTIFDVVGGGLK